MNTATRKLASCEDDLHEAARRTTGLDDFGNQAYRQGLRVLLEAFDIDCPLTEIGWHAIYRRLVNALSARLYSRKGWTEHPSVLGIPIHGPLVITGLPRTGTTALHKLLSADTQFQGLEFWLAKTPMTRPVRETWESYPEYRACVAEVERLHAQVPELSSAHEFVAGEVEECTFILLQSFVSTIWSFSTHMPTYETWVRTRSAQDSYGYYADVLRLIGASEPHKRWLLKSPFHLVEIDTLLEVFPDARIIHMHRDPLRAIPSLCSLLQRSQLEVGHSVEGGRRLCTYWRNALYRGHAACQRVPRQFFHVDHGRFRADPLGTVRSIYEYFGLTLSSQTAQRMHEWVAASPTSRHGEHAYALDVWGVTSAQIGDIFSEYRAQHHFD